MNYQTQKNLLTSLIVCGVLAGCGGGSSEPMPAGNTVDPDGVIVGSDPNAVDPVTSVDPDPVDSDSSGDPVDPVDPVTSVDPDPVDPVTTADPADPADPDTSVDPVDPVTTVDPADNTDFRPNGYDSLVFADEFTGESLDRSKWCTRMPWGGGPALEFGDDYCEKWYGNGYGDYANITENQRFRDSDSNGEPLHVVSDGSVKLRATNVAPHWYTRYEAASLRSKFVFKPDGNRSYYVTARMQLPNVRGTWPALFLIPSLEPAGTNMWPPEIDILEGPLNGDGNTNEFTVTQHAQVWQAQTDSQRSEWTYLANGFNSDFGFYRDGVSLRERWIEVGAEWAETGVCYFIDGLKTACENYRWETNDRQPGNPAALIAYLAIGGPWAGQNGIDDSRFPAQLAIDHIRVYAGDGSFVSSPGTTVTAMSPPRQAGDPSSSRQPVADVDPTNDYAALSYTLLEAEEFNGNELDRSRWCTRLIYGGGPALQVPDADCTRFGQGTADVANADNAQRFRDFNSAGEPLHVVSNGTLKLRLTKTGSDSLAPYEAGAIRSKSTYPTGNGLQYFVTARVWLPDVIGTWPSMSMMASLGSDGVGRWPPQVGLFDGPLNGVDQNAFTLIRKTHIDGAQTLTGDHEWTYVGPGFDVEQSQFGSTTTLRGRWLELGMEWTEGHVCWFINGVPSACELYEWLRTDGEVGNPATLIASLAAGGALAASNGIDDSQIPTQMEIDWIRIYRRNGF